MTHQAWINDLPESDQFAIVKRHQAAISQLTHPGKSIVQYVVKYHPDLITDRFTIDEEDQLTLVARYPNHFNKINNPSPKVCALAVKHHPPNIQCIDNPSDELKWIAYMGDPNLIRGRMNMTHSQQDEFITRWPDCYYRIDNPTSDVTYRAVTAHAFNIKYVRHPSREIQLLAFNADPSLITWFDQFGFEIIDDDIRTYAQMIK